MNFELIKEKFKCYYDSISSFDLPITLPLISIISMWQLILVRLLSTIFPLIIIENYPKSLIILHFIGNFINNLGIIVLIFLLISLYTSIITWNIRPWFHKLLIIILSFPSILYGIVNLSQREFLPTINLFIYTTSIFSIFLIGNTLLIYRNTKWNYRIIFWFLFLPHILRYLCGLLLSNSALKNLIYLTPYLYKSAEIIILLTPIVLMLLLPIKWKKFKEQLPYTSIGVCLLFTFTILFFSIYLKYSQLKSLAIACFGLEILIPGYSGIIVYSLIGGTLTFYIHYIINKNDEVSIQRFGFGLFFVLIVGLDNLISILSYFNYPLRIKTELIAEIINRSYAQLSPIELSFINSPIRDSFELLLLLAGFFLINKGIMHSNIKSEKCN